MSLKDKGLKEEGRGKMDRGPWACLGPEIWMCVCVFSPHVCQPDAPLQPRPWRQVQQPRLPVGSEFAVRLL